MPAVRAVIISLSAGLSCGCQMSKISTTRSWSLSFQASCSIVSSKTQALPGTHSRVSLPTRKPQPSGTISGRCVTSRALVTPVCGGMRVLGFSSENIALGVRPACSGCGAPPRGIVELDPLIVGDVGRIGDVGNEALVGAKDREELFPDLVRGRFDRV